MKKKLSILSKIISAALLASIVSCSTAPVCVTSSASHIGQKRVEKLGHAQGSSSTWSVLGLWMVGKPDIDSAINSAINEKNGDALVNVRVYESTSCFLLFSINTVTVEGEAVKIIEGKDK